MRGTHPSPTASGAAIKAELPVVSQRGSGRTLLWATEENPLFDSGYAIFCSYKHCSVRTCIQY